MNIDLTQAQVLKLSRAIAKLPTGYPPPTAPDWNLQTPDELASRANELLQTRSSSDAVRSRVITLVNRLPNF